MGTGCINEGSTLLFTLVAIVKIVMYLLIWLHPKSDLSTILITTDIAVVTEALIAANLATLNLDDIASAMIVLFGLALLVYCILCFSTVLLFVMTTIGVFGSAIVVN